MYTKGSEISVVWFKRDLRLQDNEAIAKALESGLPVLLLYVFEPSLRTDPHYSQRHWNFIKESIVDMNEELGQHNTKVLAVPSELIPAINKLQQFWRITKVFSHQETGLRITYDRDKNFSRFCKNNLIEWQENVNNGVFRGLKDRKGWKSAWENYMKQPRFSFAPKPDSFIPLEDILHVENYFEFISLNTPEDSPFQNGGTSMGKRYLRSFIESRHRLYNKNISKPLLSRSSCSRLSPYLSWGNLSVREVWQMAKSRRSTSENKKALDGFTSRLRWQAHFIQKFEMEEIMEFVSVNKGYRKLKKKYSKKYQKAWKTGYTGFPLVDASMRCLNETGYVNFRMRAMLVSFFTHHLWQPWQAATTHLSSMFLDFEPGIHFPQLQMQAGETGINALRIYNPIKNGKEHDPEGEFIKKWVPELAQLPLAFLHEPYLLTPMEQNFFNFELGKDYPEPIVDIGQTRKQASDTLWSMRKNTEVSKENKRILKKHTLSNRNPFD